jgi:lysophospholipase
MRSASLLTVDGSRHEILQEADLYREQMLAAAKAFMLGEATAEA